MSELLNNLQKMLGTEHENQLLHYSIGNEYLKSNKLDLAEEHLRKAVSLAPDYSAGWKLLGKTLNAAEKYEQAIDVFLQGILVSEKKAIFRRQKK